MDAIEKEYGSSPYAKQLSQGFVYPRFQPPLETEYRTAFNAQNTGRIKIGVLVTVVVVLLSTLVDFLTFPEGEGLKTMAVSLGIMLPGLLISYWATTQSRFIPNLHWVLFATSVVLGASIILISYIAATHNYAPQALLLVIIFTYFVSGLFLHLAAAAGVLVCGVFFILKSIEMGPTPEIVQCGFVLLAANMLGIVGCYSLECMHRAAFLRAGAANDLAGVDELTGMPNRRRFLRHSEALWMQAKRDKVTIAIMLLDIDFFKRYNDSVGHLAGDKCLRRISGALLTAPRRSLDMVARFGGEEFIAIWFPGNPDAIGDMAGRLHNRVNSIGVLHPDSEISNKVTVSIGVSTCHPGDGLTLMDAIELADRALYQAKENGRNRIVHVNCDQPDHFSELRS